MVVPGKVKFFKVEISNRHAQHSKTASWPCEKVEHFEKISFLENHMEH